MSSGRSRSGAPRWARHQAVEEVLAEPSLLDNQAEVDGGGGDEAHVDFDRAGAAQPVHRPILERAHELWFGWRSTRDQLLAVPDRSVMSIVAVVAATWRINA
jgi:hypothetical protein